MTQSLKCGVVFLMVLCCTAVVALAQNQRIADSIAAFYSQASLHDTVRLRLLNDLAYNETRDYELAIKYADQLVALAKQLDKKESLYAGYFIKGAKQRVLGRYEAAIGLFFTCAAIAKESKLLTAEANAYGAIADVYSGAENHAQAVAYYHTAIHVLEKAKDSKDSTSLGGVLSNIGDEYYNVDRYDSAMWYFNRAKTIFTKVNYSSGIAYSLGNIGMVYASTGKKAIAEQHINNAIRLLQENQDHYPICSYLNAMAELYLGMSDSQTALTYALRSLQLAERYKLKGEIVAANLSIAKIYEQANDFKNALTYFKAYVKHKDELNNKESDRKITLLNQRFVEAQNKIEVALLTRQKINNRNLNYALGIILVLTFVILVILFRNNKNRQKAYTKLKEQKQETEKLKVKAEETLSELQVTQQQLIQTAKMASLGELTAGIAHEIQNPLNFVNNFSDTNKELLVELEDEIANGNYIEVKQLAAIIKTNEEKITHHGRRAGAIVKSMLQHSRASTGKRELTNINQLAEEYLQLSIQGQRNKDKSSAITIVTQFDDSIAPVLAIPQDVGRVFLNLLNNAIYAVNEKKKLLNGSYEPTITVSTTREGPNVVISIKDNGTGMPQEVTDKVFQPFFTTKPTGEGTGLGLSMSYDIVTKGHNGTLKVKSTAGEGTEFLIHLPVV